MKKIALHSVPRSGSTWLGSILDSSSNIAYRYQPLFSYSHKGFLNANSNQKKIFNFFDDIYKTNDEFVLQKQSKTKGLVLDFNKEEITHIVYKEVRYHHILINLLNKSSSIKVIGLVRSPFAVINSWLKAPKEFRGDLGWLVEEEWRDAPKKNMNKPEEYNGYTKWKEASFLFLKLLKEHPKQFYLISYDDLLSNTVMEVKQLFEFCNLEYTKQTDAFIKQSTASQSSDAYSVFKKKSDDTGWKKTLPVFIENAIKEDEEFIKLNEIFKWI